MLRKPLIKTFTSKDWKMNAVGRASKTPHRFWHFHFISYYYLSCMELEGQVRTIPCVLTMSKDEIRLVRTSLPLRFLNFLMYTWQLCVIMKHAWKLSHLHTALARSRWLSSVSQLITLALHLFIKGVTGFCGLPLPISTVGCQEPLLSNDCIGAWCSNSLYPCPSLSHW